VEVVGKLIHAEGGLEHKHVVLDKAFAFFEFNWSHYFHNRTLLSLEVILGHPFIDGKSSRIDVGF